MDPELQTLAINLADTAVRNTAGAVADRISAARARKKDQETVAELEEIVNELIADKSELVRIAQAFEQELVAQRISSSDVEYIVSHVVPVITKLVETNAGSGSGSGAGANAGVESVEEMLEVIKPILSVETINVLQLLGFNFRKAVGEPLTELVSSLIRARTAPSPEQTQEAQRLYLALELARFEIVKDPDAYQRLMASSGSSGASS